VARLERALGVTFGECGPWAVSGETSDGLIVMVRFGLDHVTSIQCVDRRVIHNWRVPSVAAAERWIAERRAIRAREAFRESLRVIPGERWQPFPGTPAGRLSLVAGGAA
jgi:hypothetical protein